MVLGWKTPGKGAPLPASQWESSLPSKHIHTHTYIRQPLCKLVLCALNNNGVTRVTRQGWSMCLCLINRAQRESLVCLSLCAADFLMSQRQIFGSGRIRRFFYYEITAAQWYFVCVCVRGNSSQDVCLKVVCLLMFSTKHPLREMCGHSHRPSVGVITHAVHALTWLIHLL